MTYRIVVKEIAAEHGVYATFMPKPLFGENGSGMHTHQSLFSGGKNAFFDADGDYHLSDTAGSYIAGLLRTSTPTSGSCLATRRRSTARGRSETAPRSSGSPSITPARSRRRAASSAARIPPATRT